MNRRNGRKEKGKTTKIRLNINPQGETRKVKQINKIEKED